MSDLRLFLAIDIPDLVRERITEVQNVYKALNLDAAWVKPSNMHLTVKFLGNTEPGLIPKITERMTTIAHATPPFSLTFGNVGVFPNLSRPRVLWIGLDEPQGLLDFLREKVEQEMASLGFPADNKKPVHHLTLGRIKSGKGVKSLKRAVEASQPLEIKPFGVSAVQLIKSELTPQGSNYSVLEKYVFNGPTARDGI